MGVAEKTLYLANLLPTRAGVHTVEHEAVEVGVRVQRRPEALDRGDGAADAAPHTVVVLGTATQVGEPRAQEGAEYLAREPQGFASSKTGRVQRPSIELSYTKHAT